MFRQLKGIKVRKELAQTLSEYSMVLGIVAAVGLAMVPMIKRTSQSMIKLTADQIGIQEEGEQRAFVNSMTKGHLESAYISTRSNTDKVTREFFGTSNYTSGDVIFTYFNSVTNAGFTAD